MAGAAQAFRSWTGAAMTARTTPRKVSFTGSISAGKKAGIALVAQASSVVVGDGMDAATKLGPIQNRPQFDRVTGLVDGALSSGARAAAGGAALDRPGYFLAPTILTDAADGTAMLDEEQFGRPLPVISYRDLDDAIERANATTFGLGASVWATDTERGEAVARQLDAGSAWVNTHAALAPNLPFGGLRWSGVGVENGPWGYKGFTDMQLLNRRRKQRPTQCAPTPDC